jgi:hypothetical protein
MRQFLIVLEAYLLKSITVIVRIKSRWRRNFEMIQNLLDTVPYFVDFFISRGRTMQTQIDIQGIQNGMLHYLDFVFVVRAVQSAVDAFYFESIQKYIHIILFQYILYYLLFVHFILIFLFFYLLVNHFIICLLFL